MRKSLLATEEEVGFSSPLTVECGANTQILEAVGGYAVGEVRHKMREVLNITDDHTITLVDGREVGLDHVLVGNEKLEFKKPAGEKG